MPVFEVTHKITRTETRRILAKDFESAAKNVCNLNVVDIRLVEANFAPAPAPKLNTPQEKTSIAVKLFNVEKEFMEFLRDKYFSVFYSLKMSGKVSPKNEASLFKSLPTKAPGDWENFFGIVWTEFKKKYPEETKNYRLRRMYRGPRPEGNQSYCLKRDAKTFSLYIYKER